jgi:hypothetical protein
MRILGDPSSKEFAAASLLLAMAANFALGNLDAAFRGDWQLAAWPRIVLAHYLSPELVISAKLIVAALGTALVGAFTIPFVAKLSNGHALDALLALVVGVVVPATLTAAFAAAGLYSAKLWHEDLDQLRDTVAALQARLAGKVPPPRLNASPRTPEAVAKAAALAASKAKA